MAKKAAVKIGEEEYEEIPAEANAGAIIISDWWIKLGKPDTPLTDSGEKLMNIMIAVWEDLYPRERIEWLALRQEYKKAELSMLEQVRKQTGRSLASYPLPLYNMMKKVFPNFDPTKRDNAMKMVKKWPMFLMANKA